MIKYYPETFIKTVAASGTPEVLGATVYQMHSIMFLGEYAFDTNNTGDVFIQVINSSGSWVDTLKVQPGQAVYWPITGLQGGLSPTDFRLRVTNNGEGVRVIYSRTNS